MKGNDPPKDEETDVGSSRLKEKGNLNKEPDKLEEVGSEKNPNNIVTSLAEKAMSVAGPVVPTKEDGEVDQERCLTHDLCKFLLCMRLSVMLPF